MFDYLGLGLPGSGFGFKQYLMTITGLILLLTGIFILNYWRFYKNKISLFWKYFSLLLLTIIFLSGSYLVFYPSQIVTQIGIVRTDLKIDQQQNSPSLEELLGFFEKSAQDKWHGNQELYNLDQPVSTEQAQALIDAILLANRNSINNNEVTITSSPKVSDLQEQLIGETNNARRYRVKFKNSLGLTVEGILSIPLSEKPHPLIIIPNGMNSTPENLFLINHEDYQHGVASKFEGDYVVFALNIPSSLDSSYELKLHNEMNWAAELSGLDYRYYLTTDKVISALDYLESRPEIDPSRVAVYGISLGGEAAIRAGVIDPRISVIAASGTNIFTPSYDLLKLYQYNYPYYYQYNRINLPDLGILMVGAYPRRIIIELNRQDTTGIFQEALLRVEQIKRIYSLFGRQDDVAIVTFDQGVSNLAPQGHEMEITQVKKQIDQWFNVQP